MNKRLHNPVFAKGEKVVFISASKSDDVMTVFKVQGDGVLLDGNRSFALSHLLRRATGEEIKADRRIRSTYDDGFDRCTDIRNHLSPMTIVRGD